MNTNEVCGQFPEFCYRAFTRKEYAEDFMYKGAFRMGCQLSYKYSEDKSRCDPTEGDVSIEVPGIVTYYGYSQDPAEEPICSQRMGYRKESGGSINPRYCFCASLPDVDINHMKEYFGEYIVKIKDPRKLAEDINNYSSNNAQAKFLIVGFNVVYNKGQKSEKQLTTNKLVDLSYTQKPESFSADYEFRIVAINLSKSCTGECKFIDEEFEQVDQECKYVKINLGKQLDYTQLCES